MPVRCPLHIVTGKGGVGKTTVALAFAQALADGGARVVVAEVEGRAGLSLATGAPVTAQPTPLPGNRRIEIVQIDARASLSAYLQRYYRLGFAADLLQLDPLVDFATGIAPGLRDILLIGQVTHLTETHRGIDALVLDAPPAGRIGAFLGAGQALAELTDGSPISAQAASVMADLREGSCRTHVVTLLEELPVAEAIETVQAVRGLGLRLGSVLANRTRPLPELPAEMPPAPAGVTEADWAALTEAVVADAEQVRGQSAWHALLRYRTGLPVLDLPEGEPDDLAAALRVLA